LFYGTNAQSIKALKRSLINQSTKMLRFPTVAIKTWHITSTARTQESANTFPIDDFSGLVAKFTCSTLNGTAPLLDVWVQTSDDGGTTFYDVGKFKQASETVLPGSADAEWMFIACDGGDARHVGTATKKGIAAGGGAITGLPIVGRIYNLQSSLSGTITAANYKVEIFAQSVEPR
jgi:hypothetical protein